MKYIRKVRNANWIVTKMIDGHNRCFGGYPSLETARVVRDRLVKANWDRDEYQKIRDELRAEGVEL